MKIDSELLAAYAEGNVSPTEREAVRRCLAENPGMMESVLFAMDITNETDIYIKNLSTMLDEIAEFSHSTSLAPAPLPMAAMAAKNAINNLCVIKCEGIALRNLGIDITDEQLLKESKQAGWLRQEGTALHNIGRLSESRGLSVCRRYYCTIEDIQKELAVGNVLIAVVDGNELLGDYAKEQKKDAESGTTPNHAVIVLSIATDSISVIDPAINNQVSSPQPSTFTTRRFLDAWNDSSYYLVTISDGAEYIPHPIRLDDVVVENELLELREAIAENAHEVWAETRKNEGWTYGPVRDDTKKQHPDLLPYNRLPESEKEYDRLMAMNTIKLVKKLGWELRKEK